MLMLLFSEKLNLLEDWVNSSGKQRYKQFGRSKIRQHLSDAKKAKFDWMDEHFDFYSEFGGHPSSQSILAHFDGEITHTGPYPDGEKYQNYYCMLGLIVWHATDIAGLLWDAYFPDKPLEDVLPKEIERFEVCWPQLDQCISSLQNQ